MTNQEVNEYMQRFLDDDLSEEELEALTEHIRLTPASAILFERLQRLDSELEQLPKVIPPISIVDSILPQLELSGLSEHSPVAEAAIIDDKQSRVVPVDRRATLRDRVNFRVLGGVVAAGIVLTLFFSNFGPQMSFNTADDNAASNMIMSTQMVAEGKASLTNEAASKQSMFNEAGQNDARGKEIEAGNNSSATEPVAPESDMNTTMTMDAAEEAPAPWVDNGISSEYTGTAEKSAPINEPKDDRTISETPPDTKITINNDPATEAIEEPAEERFMFNTMSLLPAAVSPNEQLTGTVTAAAEGGQQIFIADQSGNQVYESEIYLGSLQQLTWSPDSTQLHFEAILDNETTVHMTIHVSAQTETIKKAE